MYDKYAVLVWSVAMKYTQDAYLSEDICQEVFEKLHKKAAHIPPEKLKAWLLVVTKNQALDYMKKMRRDEIMLLDEETKQIGSIQNEPLRNLVYKETRIEMLEALRDSDPEGFEMMMQMVFEGIEPRELAARRHVTLNSVYTRAYRIRKWMRKNFPEV